MSVNHGKSDRRILPRWRLSRKVSGSPEFSSINRTKQVLADVETPLINSTDEFAKAPTIGVAADLISSSILSGKMEASTAAVEFVLAHENEAPHTLLNLAKSLAYPVAIHEAERNFFANTAQTRKLLRIYPNNPMLWADMARHHASLANKKLAKQCMQTALQLAPNHRWMLRTASRFFVHQGDAEAAHKLLATHTRTRHDPWLMAAELASAQVAGRPPKYWRQAGDILKRDSVPPHHISELATAVAMMELEAGGRKKAKKFVNKGLVSPTENTLAQVFWATENRHLQDVFRLDELVRTAPDAYEADFQLNLSNGELLLALDSADTWSNDEPFAARPKAEMAYIASLLDDYELAIRMSNEVERLDSGKSNQYQTSVMNRIFSTLSSGKLTLEKNGSLLEKLRNKLTIAASNEDAYHAVANLGLWHYRYGDIDKGRGYYQKAILNAQKLHSLEAAALAATFSAREAILARDASASELLVQAKELSRRSKSKASEFYIRKLEALSKDPSKSKQILSPQSANNFIMLEANPVEYRIEKTAQGQTIIIPSKKLTR